MNKDMVGIHRLCFPSDCSLIELVTRSCKDIIGIKVGDKYKAEICFDQRQTDN